jgi:Tol biopolymer transport system component
MAEEIRVSDFGLEVGVADWSPDGTRLVFDSWDRGGTSRASRPWIATLDLDSGKVVGTEQLPLPSEIRSVEWEAWSPEDDEIALTAYIDKDRRALWVLRPDGSNATKMIDYTSSTYGGLDWTPNGKAIMYSALAGERMQLFAISRQRRRASSTDPRGLACCTAGLLTGAGSLALGRCNRRQSGESVGRKGLTDARTAQGPHHRPLGDYRH